MHFLNLVEVLPSGIAGLRGTIRFPRFKIEIRFPSPRVEVTVSL